MKKVILLILLLLLFVSNSVFAYSESFELVISAMDVSVSNVRGKYLNEDIYNTYSLIVYGSPNDGYAGQRWKNVADGLWNNGTANGEYWILGENKEGYEVHNHKFPVDIEPPTSPETWRYAIISDAKNSWTDQSKYMDDVQKEYMLTQKLTRNDIAYDLTVQDIGLDKVRLENYATWKTKGTVYTQRYDKDNKKWAANFMVPPMAAESEIDGFAHFPDGKQYYFEESKNSITIPILYGADVTKLTDYAKKEHVKEIKSQLFINDVLIDEVFKSEALHISGDATFVAHKNIEEGQTNLHVKIKSTLLTKFTTDGALVDIKEYDLIIFNDEEIEENEKNIEIEDVIIDDGYIEPETYDNRVRTEEKVTSEEIPPPIIKDISITRINNGSSQELPVAKSTDKAFICAGQTISIRVVVANQVDKTTLSFEGDSSIFTFDDVTKLIEWDEPRSRNRKTYLSSLQKYKNMYRSTTTLPVQGYTESTTEYIYNYIIPYGTKQTLNSWNTLRNESQDAFSIDEKKLFTRIRKPYQIVIKAKGAGGVTTKRVELDVFERWDTLYNRDLSKYIKVGE